MSSPVTRPVPTQTPYPCGETKTPNVPDLKGLVENLRNTTFLQVPVTGLGDSTLLDANLAMHHSMNLIPYAQPKMNRQHTDPTDFFKQLGCSTPPRTCTSGHLQSFFQMVDSYRFSNFICISEFLDFDVLANLKKIHETCESSLKPKIQQKIQQCYQMHANTTYSLAQEVNFLPYIRDVGLFRQELLQILKKTNAGKGDTQQYLFPNLVKKIDQNYYFLLQFIEKEYGMSLFTTHLSKLSGTHNLLPKNISHIPKVLENVHIYAEFVLESMIIGHKSKMLPVGDVCKLREILAQVQTLKAANKDQWKEECTKLRSLCKAHLIDSLNQIFFHFEFRDFFPVEDLSNEYFNRLTASIADHRTRKKVVGLINVTKFLNNFNHIIEESILSIVDHDFTEDLLYQNRTVSLLQSMHKDLEDYCEMENLATPIDLEKSRTQFYKKLNNQLFQEIASILLNPNKKSTNISIYFRKRLFDLLKKETDEAIQSLQAASKTELSENLFQKTQWLAKALLLVHDLGILVGDPEVTQEIEFHPEYINLIHQYDPSIALLEPETMTEDEIPSLSMHIPEPIAEPAEIKTETAAPPTQDESPKHLPKPKAPQAVPAAPPRIPSPKLERADLQDAIRATHGDLRKMSRVLRTLLGWEIKHTGKKHPTILDGNKRPVAPIPTTGHAGTGTVASVANSVCNAATAQGLL